MKVVYEDDLNEPAALHVGEVSDRLVDLESIEFAVLVLESIGRFDRGHGGVVSVVVHAEPESTGATVGYLAS